MGVERENREGVLQKAKIGHRYYDMGKGKTMGAFTWEAGEER